MEKNFDLFISQLSETNATLDYFTDFEKVIRNTNKIAIKLNQLNYLIGKEDLRKAIKELYDENPKVFEVLDILLAVRTKDKKKTLNIISRKSGQKIPKIANLQYYKSKANYGTKKKGISR